MAADQMTTPGSGAASGFAGSAEIPASSLYREHGEQFGLPLSPRQAEALAQLALARGSAKAAAATMGITLNAFKGLLTLVYARLGAQSAIDAYLAAGWLRLPSWASPRAVAELDLAIAEAQLTLALRRYREALLATEQSGMRAA